MRTKKYTSHGPANFLKKTYDILSNKSLSSIITWTEDGKSFLITDIYSFTNNVLPSYFKHSNLSSFIRQLNMYGFHKSKEVHEDIFHFSHPLFSRDDKGQLNKIRRKPSEPSNNLKKDEIVEMLQRLQRFKHQQVSMESTLKNLESLYSQVIDQNQLLMSEIFQSKQREKQIEILLRTITQKTKEEVYSGERSNSNSINLDIEPKYPEDMGLEEEWSEVEDLSND